MNHQRSLRCKHCHRRIYQQLEKAIGEPRETAWALVWGTEDGDWTCRLDNGNEHTPNFREERA